MFDIFYQGQRWHQMTNFNRLNVNTKLETSNTARVYCVGTEQQCKYDVEICEWNKLL